MHDISNIKRELAELDVHPWCGCSPDDVVLTTLTGGLTNHLYKAVYTKDSLSEPTSVILVRIFGDAEGLLNREVENLITVELAKRGLCPKLYGVFEWGRFEEFLTSNVCLENAQDVLDMNPACPVLSLVATGVKVLHETEIDISTQVASADIFDVLSNWYSLTSKYAHTIRATPRLPHLEPPALPTLLSEINFVKNTCLHTVFSHSSIQANPLCMKLFRKVLCHNDLLGGNIMLNRAGGGSVRFIDFEYAGYNYAAADIANIFTAVVEGLIVEEERSGSAESRVHEFPSRETQLVFLHHYFGSEMHLKDLIPLLTVLMVFALANELRWILWCVIQDNQSTLDVDYVWLYNRRFESYKTYKTMLHQLYSELDI